MKRFFLLLSAFAVVCGCDEIEDLFLTDNGVNDEKIADETVPDGTNGDDAANPDVFDPSTMDLKLCQFDVTENTFINDCFAHNLSYEISGNKESMCQCNEVGVYLRRTDDTKGLYLPVDLDSMGSSTLIFSSPEKYDVDYSSYAARSEIVAGAYAVIPEKDTLRFDERTTEFVYDAKPEILFTDGVCKVDLWEEITHDYLEDQFGNEEIIATYRDARYTYNDTLYFNVNGAYWMKKNIMNVYRYDVSFVIEEVPFNFDGGVDHFISDGGHWMFVTWVWDNPISINDVEWYLIYDVKGHADKKSENGFLLDYDDEFNCRVKIRNDIPHNFDAPSFTVKSIDAKPDVDFVCLPIERDIDEQSIRVF